jgi:hypothetical protein
MSPTAAVITAVLVLLLGLGGYAAHQRAMNAQLQVSAQLLRDAAQTSAQTTRDRESDIAQRDAQLRDRDAQIDRIIESTRHHAAQLAELRSATHAALDRIAQEPDDGCLDRTIPERLRTTPRTVPAATAPADRGAAMQDAAHAGRAPAAR